MGPSRTDGDRRPPDQMCGSFGWILARRSSGQGMYSKWRRGRFMGGQRHAWAWITTSRLCRGTGYAGAGGVAQDYDRTKSPQAG